MDNEVREMRAWRERRFLTQGELGEIVGVSNNTISNWETGIKRPRIRNIRALAKALGVGPEQITFPSKAKDAPVAA